MTTRWHICYVLSLIDLRLVNQPIVHQDIFYMFDFRQLSHQDTITPHFTTTQALYTALDLFVICHIPGIMSLCFQTSEPSNCATGHSNPTFHHHASTVRSLGSLFYVLYTIYLCFQASEPSNRAIGHSNPTFHHHSGTVRSLGSLASKFSSVYGDGDGDSLSSVS